MRRCLITVLGVSAGVFLRSSAVALGQSHEELPLPPMEVERMAEESAQHQSGPSEGASQETVVEAAQGDAMPGMVRNPFWPVGWWPSNSVAAKIEGGGDQTVKTPAVPSNVVDWDAAEKALQSLKPAFTSGPKGKFALIGTQAVGIGDTFSLAHKGSLYSWKVVDLTKGLKIDRQNVRPIR